MKTLKAQKRNLETSTAHLRNEGFIPGVLYNKETETTHISVAENELRSLYSEIREQQAFTLSLEEGTQYTVQLQELQTNSATGAILHIDLLIV